VEYRSVDFGGTAIEAALRELPLGGLRVFQSVGSTNDEALSWISGGAPDLSVVVADEQTAGRGRSGRQWQTPRGTALAISIILRPAGVGANAAGRLAGLGALAGTEVCEALGLRTSIKWPNDVLVDGLKVAGVLVEMSWNGEQPEAAVIGIGMNVLAGSAPPRESVRYPATSLQASLGFPPDRIGLLHDTLSQVISWRARLRTDAFIRIWESRLAFRGQDVILDREGGQSITGTLDGLEPDGSLRLVTSMGTLRLPMGELHLAPANDTMR